MISDRPQGAWMPFKTGRHARLFALSLVLVAFGAASGHAEVKNVKISLDWIIQGTHAPFFVA
jgi:ABC-type nitrate/sulfonate/bicarbonate transport system substrate-binding protein